MAPGARSKFGTPLFEPEVFRTQMSCTEKSINVTVLGLFDAPTVIRRPEIVPPSLSLFYPCTQKKTQNR